ncbi:MAG: glycoside hydrolase family 5 protein [Methylocystis sp.]|uniref:glycoside hydrolase family 5 protein n=1 Tax=Methylocystis sp. TaxID=1911079 RepID=UPI003DA43322
MSRAVDVLLALGFAVTIDLHPGRDVNALLARNPASAQLVLINGWARLARHLARWPAERIFVELLNEPATSESVWRPMSEALIGEVRGQLPETYVIVGPAPYQRWDSLAESQPLSGERIVYACHYYDPMVFTHQGADWEADSPWGRAAGVPFPSSAADPALLALARQASAAGDEPLAVELRQMAAQAWDAESINRDFAKLAQWSTRHAAPVMINEFGVLKGKVKRLHRLAWLSATRRAAETHGFGWAHWDYATDFGLLDGAGAIDEGVMRALLSP